MKTLDMAQLLALTTQKNNTEKTLDTHDAKNIHLTHFYIDQKNNNSADWVQDHIRCEKTPYNSSTSPSVTHKPQC